MGKLLFKVEVNVLVTLPTVNHVIRPVHHHQNGAITQFMVRYMVLVYYTNMEYQDVQ